MHGEAEGKRRYLLNAVTHMACLGVPYQPGPNPVTADTVSLSSLEHCAPRVCHQPVAGKLGPSGGLVHHQYMETKPCPDMFKTSGLSTAAEACCNGDVLSRQQPLCPDTSLVCQRLHGMATHGCSTCSSSTANSLELILTAKDLSVDTYEELTLRGWFRRGSVPLSHYRHIHHPDCGDYETRTDVRRFDPKTSSTYKRVLRRARKACITVETVRPCMDQESFELYNSYQQTKHGKVLKAADGYCNHIVDTPLVPVTRNGIMYGTVHQLYRMNGRLVGVGVLDILPHCIVSVYMFYDIVSHEVAKLSLGVYAVLQEIEFAKRLNELGADIRDYMLGGFCPLNKKVSYKANYPPVRFCVPWASNLWFDDLRAARLLAGFSALRQSVRAHRLATIRLFFKEYGILCSCSSLSSMLQKSGMSLYELVLMIRAHKIVTKHHEADEDMDLGMEISPRSSFSPDLSESPSSEQSPQLPPLPPLVTDFAKKREALPSVLRDLCEFLLSAPTSAPTEPVSDLVLSLVSSLASEACYQQTNLMGKSPTLGHLLEAVFECQLGKTLEAGSFDAQQGITVNEVIPIVIHVADSLALHSLDQAFVSSMLLGCDRGAGEVDPDYALPVTIEEAFHGLFGDTVLDLDSLHAGLVTYQQVASDADDIQLLLQRLSGEVEVTRFSQLSSRSFAVSEWWMMSQDVLHHNLQSLAGALGRDLCQRTTVVIAEME